MPTIKKFVSIMLTPRLWGMLSTIYGVFAFIRDEFLPSDLAQKLRLGGIFNMIDWYWWVIIGLVFWVLGVAWESAKIHNKESQSSLSNIDITGGDGVTAQTINAPLTTIKNITDSHDTYNTNTYNTYNINTGKEEVRELPAVAKTTARPKRDELAFQMGSNIQEFQKRFKAIRRDVSAETPKQYGFAREILIKILDEDLSQADLVFREAKQIREKTLDLNKNFNEYGTYLGILISVQHQEVFDQTTLNEIPVRLWGDDPLSITKVINSLIRQLIDLLNQEGTDNHQQKKIDELPNVEIEGHPYIKNGSLNMSLHSVPLGGSSGNERVIPIFIKVAFAQAEFANHPKEINANSTAKNVRAKITYLKPDKSVIGFVMGRWAGEDNSQDLEIVDLLSNGKPRVLYLAMKYADDDRDGLYMYGMETSTNYFWHRHEDNSYKIDEDRVVVRVEVIGERVRLTKEFMLHNEEQELQIEVLSEN